MAYISQVIPRQVSGVQYDTINSGTLTIENPDDTTGLLPLTVNIQFDIPTQAYFFSVDEAFNATSNYKFTMVLNFTLVDGTVCDRTIVYFDTLLNDAAYSTGYSIGFES